MTQKLNNNQLRQLYFDNPTPSKSFRKREDHMKASGSKQSFFDTSTSYERFNEKEIKRFENFFNTYVDPAPQDYIFKESEVTLATPAKSTYVAGAPHETKLQPETGERKTTVLGLSQLEKDLIKQIKLDDEHETSADRVVPIESVVPTDHVDVKDDDLRYLEALVNSGIATPGSNSLSDLFAEIVDNEKASISNYESSVFDANVQMLFEEDEFTPPPLQSEPSEAIEMPITPTFDLDLPPLPETAKMAQELAVERIPETIETPEIVVPKFAEAYVEEVLEGNDESFIEASIEEFVSEKRKKNSKLGILDTILVLVILAIIGVLAYSQRHMLPFDLPF